MTIQFLLMMSGKGLKSDNEPEHVWEDTNTEIDTPEDSDSHGIGASPRLGVFFENKDGTRADPNVNPEPGNYLSLLLNLIRQLNEPLSAVNGLRYQYAQVANKIGAKTIEKRILRSLSKDVQRLNEIGSLNLDTIKSCDKAQARLCFLPGVYIHVIYDPADPAFIGVYIGLSLCIGSRIKDHIEDLIAA
jgi:hypothetical protein